MGLAKAKLKLPSDFLGRVAAKNDPKCPPGWHRKYVERIGRDYVLLSSYIPVDAKRIMDIGCGFAGIDAMLGRANIGREFLLVDGDGSAPRRAGFLPAGIPWYDVEIAADLVRANCDCAVSTVRVPPIPEPWPCDVILSLKSWGHHYPVGEYLDFARRSLRPGGLLIIDIRVGTGGIQTLCDAGFRLVARISGTAKADRLVFER